jgi:hypothetical protein
MSDRDNGKTLHVEELQSDWGQEGRKKGFQGPETDAKKNEAFINVQQAEKEFEDLKNRHIDEFRNKLNNNNFY